MTSCDLYLPIGICPPLRKTPPNSRSGLNPLPCKNMAGSGRQDCGFRARECALFAGPTDILHKLCGVRGGLRRVHDENRASARECP